jgi:hypothetical protein
MKQFIAISTHLGFSYFGQQCFSVKDQSISRNHSYEKMQRL